MATKIVDIRVAANTSSGAQFIDAPTDWGTANAAIVVCGKTASDSTGATGDDDICMSVGFTDGTRQVVGSVASEHNVGDTNSYSKGNTSRIILLLDPSDGSVLAEATFIAFTADTLRISWNTAPPAGYFVMARLMQVKNAYANTCSSVAGAVTAPGFRPSLVKVLGNGTDSSFADTLENGAWLSLGFATALPTLRQCSVSWSSADGEANSAPECTARDDAVLQWDSGANAFTGRFAIESFDSTGFTIDAVGTPDVEPTVAYLAIELEGNTPAWCGIITSPTGATPQATAYRDWGLTPIAVMHAACFADSTNTTEDDGGAATFSISMHDGTSEFSMAISEEDGQATTDNQTLAQPVAVRIPTGTITQGPRGSWQSYDADGMTINWTSVSNAQRRIATLAIGRPRHPIGIVRRGDI